MKIQKEYITENRRADNRSNIISRIGFVTSEGCDYLNSFSQKLCESTLAFCRKLENIDNISGDIVALLTPTVTYMRDDIISVKYDFTLSANGIIIHHKRFCVNIITSLGILLLPRFLVGKSRPRNVSSFYLVPEGEDITAVTVARNLEQGMRIGRRSDIDAYCDGKCVKVRIRIPKCVNKRSLSKCKKGRTSSAS